MFLCYFSLLLPYLHSGEYSVVYGSRFLNRQNRHSYPAFYWGGRLVSFIASLLYGQVLTDEPTCYKMFRSSLLKSIPLDCTGFEFCPEITAKVLKKGYKIKEVAVAGGVSANNGLRNAIREHAEKYGWNIFIPKFSYTTDNAAMIAITGYFKYLDKDFCSIDLPAYSRVTL